MRVNEVNAQTFASTALAFATPGQPDSELFTALARAGERQVNEFNALNLANIAWAFASQSLKL